MECGVSFVAALIFLNSAIFFGAIKCCCCIIPHFSHKFDLFIREKNPKLSRKSLRLIRTNVRVYCHIIRPIQCLTNPLYTN